MTAADELCDQNKSYLSPKNSDHPWTIHCHERIVATVVNLQPSRKNELWWWRAHDKKKRLSCPPTIGRGVSWQRGEWTPTRRRATTD